MTTTNAATPISDDTPKTGLRTPLDAPIRAIASRFGDRAKEMERFLRFAIVGITGAVIDFGLVYMLQWTILPPTRGAEAGIAAVIASTVAVVSNFFWTRYWVYPESRSRTFRRQLGMFIIVSAIGLTFRFIWVTLAAIPLGQILLPVALPFIEILRPGYVPGPLAANKFGTLIAQMGAMVIVMFWNFFANRYWTYNDVK
ncbi:MAG: GtrA family protein [Anaerolineae bacterium]|jgi:putative flippase GtrA|nr:GtrA family protein [Anaerolineae bacterium]